MAIWDSPAAGGFGSSGTKVFSANATKCPNCASNLVFDSDHGALICRNCGALFDPETLDKVGSFGLVNPDRNRQEYSFNILRILRFTCTRNQKTYA